MVVLYGPTDGMLEGQQRRQERGGQANGRPYNYP